RTPPNLVNDQIDVIGRRDGLRALDRFGLFCYVSRLRSARRCVMAKQRRPSKPVKAKPASSSVVQAGRRPLRPQTPAQAPQEPPQRRSTYVEAVAVYERGLDALQRHDYASATSLLESVLLQ